MPNPSAFSFVVFTATEMVSVRQSIASLLEHFPTAQITVLQHAPQKSVKQLLRSQQRNLKRHGWRWIPYQSGEVVRRVVAKVTKARVGNLPRVGTAFALSALKQHPRVSWNIFRSIHDPEALALAKSINPDLGISLAAPILKPALFEIPQRGTLNLHKGKVPDYKGMPPAFWELNAGESHIGCTVHFVSEKLDAGDVVDEQLVQVQPYSTVKGMQLVLDQVGVSLMAKSIQSVLLGQTKPKKQSAGGRTNSRPPLALERALDRSLAIRAGQGTGIKAHSKEAVFTGYGRIIAPVRNFLQPRATQSRIVVLLYHRIDDGLRDGVTNGIEQFDRHMATLSAHTHVLTLRDLLDPACLVQPAKKPKVVVTFDDGYEDNYAIAAPILERHGVHATFFVSTGLMGTDRAFDHDRSKLGHGLPNMNWDQLRELQRRGFDVGSHTVNHARLSKLSAAELDFELRDSKATLERELGVDAPLFAYPFGGVGDSSDEANRAVFSAGYQLCCSAYGGRNDLIDVHNIKRSTVSFAHGDSAFWAIVQGFTKVRAHDEKAAYEA